MSQQRTHTATEWNSCPERCLACEHREFFLKALSWQCAACGTLCAERKERSDAGHIFEVADDER